MWRETTAKEHNLKIWKEEFADWLPSRILDFHVHVMNEGVIPEEKPFSNGGHPITKYDYEDLSLDLAECYPGKETSAVCFGLPDTAYDQKLNNTYVSNPPDPNRFFPLRLLDPKTDTPDNLRKDLETGRYYGVKPYLVYARKENPNDVTIPDMLPDWAMEVVNDLGLCVMLHIPRKQRLEDPLNQQQVVEYCQRYPRAWIILAHIGRAYYLKNVVGQLDNFKPLPNCYIDLAMLNHWEVMQYAFREFPQERILYGTDLPIAVAPGKSVEINDQYTYVTPVPWALSISDDHGKLQFTSFLYEELRAIRKAAEGANLTDQAVAGIFHDNGRQLLDRIAG